MVLSNSEIADQIAQVRQSIPPHVCLIAVSKQIPVEAMKIAYDAGLRDFGESKVQEAAEKQEILTSADIIWHFIGHLQSNKAQKALEQFDWIHSVDSLKLAQRLNRLAADLERVPQMCLQVKPLPDPNKYGWTMLELRQDLPELLKCEHLPIRGLMTILPLGLTEAETEQGFIQVRELAHQLAQETDWPMDQLSMGMSADYAIAIRAGSTMVRIGRSLFGQRIY
ncbi:MAG: YggS family pyridoxal phosphate-dependent enzyme [Thainema sp.]